MAKSIRETAMLFEEKEKMPTLEEFKLAYMIIKDGIQTSSSDSKTKNPKNRKITKCDHEVDRP